MTREGDEMILFAPKIFKKKIRIRIKGGRGKGGREGYEEEKEKKTFLTLFATLNTVAKRKKNPFHERI